MSHESPLNVAVGVIRNEANEILISRRNESAHQGGLWEFPGGKIEHGESSEQALARELKEELNITVEKVSPLIKINFNYPDFAVHLDVRSVEVFSGPVKACDGQPLQWVPVDQLNQFSFPAANKPIITAARLPRYYAILEGDHIKRLNANLQMLLAKGVKLVQLRAKSLTAEAVDAFLTFALPFCKRSGAKLLLNSAVLRSCCYQLDGIHLTSHDLMSMRTRPMGMPWISASCHNIEELKHAEKIGLDFAVLAPVMPTTTHPEAEVLGWERFSRMVSRVNIPVYALGGMSAGDLYTSLQCGAQGIAGIRMFLEK